MNQVRKIWTEADLRIIDPVELIRKKREMYFHAGIVSVDDLIGRVSVDILSVTDARMVVFRWEEWCIIGSDHRWIPVSEDKSIPGFFFQLVPIPEREFRSMRAEVFLTAVSSDLGLFLPDFHLVVQGEVPEELLREIYPMTMWQQMVAFRLSPDMTSPSDQNHPLK